MTMEASAAPTLAYAAVAVLAAVVRRRYTHSSLGPGANVFCGGAAETVAAQASPDGGNAEEAAGSRQRVPVTADPPSGHLHPPCLCRGLAAGMPPIHPRRDPPAADALPRLSVVATVGGGG